MIKMFLKRLLSNIAYSAVMYAQNVLQGEKGENKKKVAIAYIMEKLPIWQSFKPILYRFIAEIIDESIEIAVKKMKCL